MIKNCLFCKIEFKVQQYRKNSAKFCSRTCYKKLRTGENNSNWKGGKIIKNCFVCEKKFRAWPSRIKNNWSKFCSKRCRGIAQKKINICFYCQQDFFIINSNGSQKFCSKTCRSKHKRLRLQGNGNPNWRGGVARLSDCIRSLVEYKKWRKSIYARDNYTCVLCGDNKGGNLRADHIRAFSVVIFRNNIQNIDDALQCEELWNIDNGRTLCQPCHETTDSYANSNVVKEYLYETN